MNLHRSLLRKMSDAALLWLLAMWWLPVWGGDAKLAFYKSRLGWVWQAQERSPLPEVSDADWPLHDFDHFILAGLDRAGLVPAPDASRRTWIRRVHFALTGLPPSPEQIEPFVSDPSDDPTARARVIDGLLASPHFGERWARHWMDLMRYAESRGHESDYLIANAFRYRNYLIQAFNEDLPYDRLVTEHLAGDLVPDPRIDPETGANLSVLATGWPFLGEEVHSPVDIRGDECDRIDNKVDVLGKAFLGLTIACARCHDHKFDAISQRDYYAMAGFILSSSYRQVRYESMETNRRQAERLQELRRSSKRRLLTALADLIEPGIASAAQSLKEALENSTEREDGDTAENPWIPLLKAAMTDPSHALYALAGTAPSSRDVESVSATERVFADYSELAEFWRPDGFAFGRRALGSGDLQFTRDPEAPVAGVTVWGHARFDPVWHVLRTAEDNEKDSGSIESSDYAGRMIRSRQVMLGTGSVHYLIRGKARVYAAVDSHIMLAGPLHGRLIQKHGTRGPAGLRWVIHDLSDYAGHRVHFEFSPLKVGDELEVYRIVESDSPPPLPSVGDPLLTDPDSAETAFRRAVDRMRHGALGDPATAQVADFMIRNRGLFVSGEATAAEVDEVLKQFASAQQTIQDGIQRRSRTAVSWLDGNGVDEFLLDRGDHRNPLEPCPRALPAAFDHAEPVDTVATSGRLELARQLTDPRNPLTSRVFVNRVWHHLFGRGIVATPDNFGWLGERPTHPELLDRLAHDFIHRHRWSVKSLIRELVLSRTYAMSSQPSNRVAESSDPGNQWLHRMPLRRLEGEVLRDAVLSVSGRLDRSMFGRPVPVHLTEFVVGRGRPAQSGPLDGEGRRSIYTSVRRNFLPTLMLTFDSPRPFSTVGRRTETNVPAQSLALMNDDFIYEQAGVWASASLRHAGVPDEDRIRALFERALGRTPTSTEISDCQESLEQLSAYARDDELAVWKEFCHSILTLNEFVFLP